MASFNPLEDLALSLGRKKEIQDVDAGSIEFQFVDHFFQKTAQGGQVTRVQKLVNKPIQMRFMNELSINREKNSKLALSEIVRFLWHGTRNTDPQSIMKQEIGLNVNFAR